ncbi:MAG: helix-turn-helix domain-containing protein [Nitrospirota bacterium]|nr:helix-turn-helix domain-containing protein [Nitrospirota bacterium]
MITHVELGKLLTVEDAAARLGLRVSTIRRMILERRIDTVRPSVRAVRIPESAIRRILERGFTPSIPPAGKA